MDIQPIPASPFDVIRHQDQQGEYWTARELMPLLEYSTWQKFEEVVQRAIMDCIKSGRVVEVNFNLLVKNNAGRGRKGLDYRLTRYACHLIVMAARTSGEVAAKARTYFSDTVAEAEDADISEWRVRAIRSYVAEGYSLDWASSRVSDILARNALTHEWSVRGIEKREYAILTNHLHMGAFGLTIQEHKALKEFEITWRGKTLIYKGDLPPAMTITELILNALASTAAREIHIAHDSHGRREIEADIAQAGHIAATARRQIEEITGRSVVSSRNLVREPDGGLWATLSSADADLDS